MSGLFFEVNRRHRPSRAAESGQEVLLHAQQEGEKPDSQKLILQAMTSHRHLRTLKTLTTL